MTKPQETGNPQVWIILAALVVFSVWSYWIWVNNDYSTYRNVPVTFVDRHSTNSCHKGSCSDYRVGLFRRESDGMFFERPISLYMFTQVRLGEKFDLRLRPFDMKQTTKDNIWWLFVPIIVHIITAMMWVITLIGIGCEIYERITKRIKSCKS